eukprot:scaffold213884_cov17-Tisochrysis_lutea.AAC.2
MDGRAVQPVPGTNNAEKDQDLSLNWGAIICARRAQELRGVQNKGQAKNKGLGLFTRRRPNEQLAVEPHTLLNKPEGEGVKQLCP